MNHTLREFLRRVAPIGWTYGGLTPGGHVRLLHTSGATYTCPSTPSDWRGGKNTLADLERIGGQRLPRVKTSRGRKSPRRIDAEVEASRRRHRQRFETKARHQAELEAAEQMHRAAVARAAADDRRRKEIEELMRR